MGRAEVAGYSCMALGAVLVGVGLLWWEHAVTFGGVFAFVVGAFQVGGFGTLSASFLEILSFRVEKQPAVVDAGQKKELSANELKVREQVAAKKNLPGIGAPAFNAVRDALPLMSIPWADPMTPAYLLDSEYRILDWNTAFGLAFDRTMEGKRGQSVLQWVYYLDNFEDVLDHAESFVETKELPPIDLEVLKYTNVRYGDKLTATKRAYRLPDDDLNVAGWLVTLETQFEAEETERRFRLETLSAIRLELTWTEYAVSYDRVLMQTQLYPRLLETITGSNPDVAGISPVPEDASVMDLGAGTGNLTRLLAERGRKRQIYAIENNRTMLNILRGALKDLLRPDDTVPGVVAVKQDVSSLAGFRDASMDYVFLNNVLYTLPDALSCLMEVRRVLKPRGEVRITGPKRSTQLRKLFHQIEKDLRNRGVLDELEEDLELVKRINHTHLGSMLYRWKIDDVRELLTQAGFDRVTFASEDVYAGQGMLICAQCSKSGNTSVNEIDMLQAVEDKE